LGRRTLAHWCHDYRMRTPPWLAELPLLQRYAMVAALIAGIAGCVAGLVLGLYTYVPTAWFATFELGIPAALAGAVVGLVLGSVVLTYRRVRSVPKAGRAAS